MRGKGWQAALLAASTLTLKARPHIIYQGDACGIKFMGPPYGGLHTHIALCLTNSMPS